MDNYFEKVQYLCRIGYGLVVFSQNKGRIDMSPKRLDGRKPDEMRPVEIVLGVQKDPWGSVQISYGNTVVLCAATVSESIPPWMRGEEPSQGWITSEYAMLPGSSPQRVSRQAKGRSKEIQRLIGRSLRAAIDLKSLGERTITVDCDVLQADGGTRTASVTGGFLAIEQVVRKLMQQGLINSSPIRYPICAVSCALVNGEILLDPDYSEDSRAEVDMNFVLTKDRIVEIQGTAEQEPFDFDTLNHMVQLAHSSAQNLFARMQASITRIAS